MLIMCIVTRVSNLQSVVEDFLLYYNNSGCKLSYCHLSTKYINTYSKKGYPQFPGKFFRKCFAKL